MNPELPEAPDATPANPPLALKSNEWLGHADELPPWLLPLQDATLIANTHRVRVGTVQAVAKATHRALAAENERLSAALKQANDQAEHFERAWYLRGDDMERALALLARYRDETPLGHQPHMIALEVDNVLGRGPNA